jgi:Lon protease-like protein
MTLSSDEAFAESIADVVALVARGDIAAFEIPGQTTVEATGQRRFRQTYDQLALAARAKGRKVVLRWVFDAPGSPAAAARTEANLERLTSALEEIARRESPAQPAAALPEWVRVQFAKVGPVSAAMSARLTTLGVEVVAG